LYACQSNEAVFDKLLSGGVVVSLQLFDSFFLSISELDDLPHLYETPDSSISGIFILEAKDSHDPKAIPKCDDSEPGKRGNGETGK
jgi:hypothetical protein